MKNEKNIGRPLTAILFAVIMIATVFATMRVAKASPSTPPHVICVPFQGSLAVPHDTWIGEEITLEGTAHDNDGDGTMVE